MLKKQLLSTLLLAFIYSGFAQNNGLQLDGINDYVSIENLGDEFANMNSFSVEFWMKADYTEQSSSVRTSIFAINRPAGENRFLIILGGLVNQDGLLMIYDQTAGSGPRYVGSDIVGDGECHHIAYTYDGVNGSVYIDGVLMDVHIPTYDFTSDDRFSIGQEWDNQTPSQFYNGWIDDLRIWNYSRSNIETANDMHADLNGDEPGLLAIYKMNQGVSGGNNSAISNLINSTNSGNNLDGNIENMSLTGVNSNFVLSSCSISCPGFNIDVQSTPSCENGATGQLIVTPDQSSDFTFQWGANANLETDSIVGALAPGNYFVTVTDGEGCVEDTLLEVLTIPSSSAGNDHFLKICSGDIVDLDDLLDVGVSNGNWSEISNSNQMNTNSGVFDANSLSEGIYEFEYEVQSLAPCPNDVALIKIQVLDYPEPIFSLDFPSGCPDLSVEFSYLSPSSPNYSCVWDFGNNFTEENCGGTFHIYSEPGTYSVSLTITNDNTCTKTFSLIDAVEVLDVPVANFSMSPSVIGLEESVVQFTNLSTNADAFIWDFGDESEFSTEVHPAHIYSGLEPGDFEVMLTASNEFGCFDTFGLSITVADDLYLFVPNAFTPDNDGFNQIFRPIISSGYREGTFKFEVYNRWGELIFVSNEVETGWDGTYKGKNCMDGTYVWKVYFGDKFTDDKHVKTGHLTLLR